MTHGGYRDHVDVLLLNYGGEKRKERKRNVRARARARIIDDGDRSRRDFVRPAVPPSPPSSPRVHHCDSNLGFELWNSGPASESPVPRIRAFLNALPNAPLMRDLYAARKLTRLESATLARGGDISLVFPLASISRLPLHPFLFLLARRRTAKTY